MRSKSVHGCPAPRLPDSLTPRLPPPMTDVPKNLSYLTPTSVINRMLSISYLAHILTPLFDAFRAQDPDRTRASLLKPPEKAVRVPLRPRGIVRHALDELQDHHIEFARRRFVHRLVEVVRGRVIAVLQPLLVQLLLRRPGHVAELERQRGHAAPDETVLIAADEQVALRLFVGLHLDPVRLRHRANVVAQRGFLHTLHFQILQGMQWQEHIDVDG